MTSSSPILLYLPIFFSFFCSTIGVEYYVSSSDSVVCPSDNIPCHNISYYVSNAEFYFNDDTIFYFLEGIHSLEQQGFVMINEVSNLTLHGLGSIKQGFHETVRESTVQVMCTNNVSSGFAFDTGTDITITGITFINCGGVGNYTGFFTTIYATLSFNFVKNVTLEQVSILNGTGLGVLLRNSYHVSIQDSSFSHNEIPLCEEVLCPGGNLHIIMFKQHTFDDENITNISIEIIRSNFSFGYATDLGVSGGISLKIMISDTEVNLNVLMNDIILYGNSAILAPNLDIEFTCPLGISYNVLINNTISTYGNALRPPPQSIQDVLQINAGGFYFMDQSEHIGRKILNIYNSEFSNNNVYNYGGLQISLITDLSDNVIITIDNCIIKNNTGDVGAALYGFSFRTLQSPLPNFILRNVHIEGNKLNRDDDSLFGTVLLQNFNITIEDLVIIDNQATGLVSLSSTLTFTGVDNIFRNNSGTNGGGLALYESSFLILQAPLYIAFLNNNAERKGGGVFVSQVTMRTTNIKSSCFFQLPDGTNDNSGTNIELYFEGNTANISGDVLYGGNVPHCSNSVSFNRVFNYTQQSGLSVISSDPNEICYCKDQSPYCLQYRETVSISPGEMFTVELAPVGQFEGVTPAVLQLTDYTTESSPVKRLVDLHAKCNLVKYTFNQSASLVYLSLDGVSNPVNDTQTKLLKIEILPCPPGFTLDTHTGLCQCDAILEMITSVECNVTTQLMSREGSVWMGYDNTSNCTIVRRDCPYDYCLSSRVTFHISNPDPQCDLHRSGIMCGQCAEGYSLLLGSNQCDNSCTNVYLLLIPVFALAGFVLVAFLIALNLTVSKGTINGLIFYANIIKINEDVFFPNGPIPVLSQFISWINLDFGIQSCFYKGMTSLDKAWLHFVFPVYIWIIIIILIVLARYFSKVAKLLGNNAVPVLATLLLLAYSKIFRAAVNAFNSTVVRCGRDSVVAWYIDPNIYYYDPAHISLVIVGGIFFILLALPFTMILLFNYPISIVLNSDKLHACGCHSNRLGIRLFFRAYNAPYKSMFGFWTGLLLLVRFILVFIVSFSSNSHVIVATITLTAILLGFMGSFGGVYEKKPLDILEASFLLNLIFISAIIQLQYAQIAIIIGITLALITFLGILIFHIIQRFKDTKYIRPLMTILEACIEKKKRVIAATNPVEKSKENGRSRAVSTTSIELTRRRETLLSDDLDSEQGLTIRSHKSSNKL